MGSPVSTNTVVGNISQYFVERFGFDARCQIVAFTGDNPSSMAGESLKKFLVDFFIKCDNLHSLFVVLVFSRKFVVECNCKTNLGGHF